MDSPRPRMPWGVHIKRSATPVVAPDDRFTRTAMDALLVRVPDVAQQLGLSRAKVYELMARGLLPSVKLDGCRRVRSEDLQAFTDNLQASWPEAARRTERPRVFRTLI